MREFADQALICTMSDGSIHPCTGVEVLHF
jgi:hypothetical protein